MDANKYFQILHMISAGGQKVCRKFLIGKGLHRLTRAHSPLSCAMDK